MKIKPAVTPILALLFLLYPAYAFAAGAAQIPGGGTESGGASWLASAIVAAALLFIGFTGLLLAMLLSGFGAAGLAAVAAFGLFFFGSFQAGYSSPFEAFFFVAGIVLLASELFVPSFGLLGLLGMLALFRAILWSFADFGTALICMLSALTLALCLATIISKRFKDRGIWNRFILRERLTSENGFLPTASKQQLLGSEGIAVTPLRPAGIVEIAGERIDVVTSGEFIASNTVVFVVRVDGTRVIVRARN